MRNQPSVASRTAFLVGVLTALGPLCAAMPVRVLVTRVQDAAQPTPTQVVANRVASVSSEGALDRLTVSVDEGGGVIDLAPGAWVLRAHAPGFWGAPESVFLAAQEEEQDTRVAVDVRLTLWATGTVVGQAAATTENLPEQVELTFRSSPRASRDLPAWTVPQSSVKCPLERRVVRCEVPAGLLDLEFRASAFAPHYRWDVEVPARVETDVKIIPLRRGSSLVGWVQNERRTPLPAARVELLSSEGQPILSTSGPLKSPLLTSTNDRGFFQLVSIPPANYHVVARQAGLSSPTMGAHILQDQETRLDTPLIVTEPLTLQVVLDPPVDPWDRPWQVSLLAGGPPHPTFVVRGENVATTGHWRREGLSPGSYRLVVVAPSRGKWFNTRFELESGSEPLQVQIPVLRVRGRAHFGDQPLQGKLVFSNDEGARVAFESTEDGAFHGRLPQAATEARRWDVSVVSKNPQARRTVEGVEVAPGGGSEAWVDVSLPDTALRGRLMTLSGQTWRRGAVVTAQHTEGSNSLAQGVVREEDQGHFRLEGLTPGAYWVWAGGEKAESERVSVVLEKGSESSPVHLVMRETRRLDGRIVSSGGTGIPGAVVLAFPVSLPGSLVRLVYTDVDGRFSSELAPGTNELCMSIGAPGFAYKIMRRSLPDDSRMVVTLERDGGTLFLENVKDPAGQVGTTAYLVREGSFEALNSLMRWAGANGGSKSPDGRMALPNMAPGQYSVCWAGMTEGSALIFAGLPPGRCASGTLLPGGAVTLELPRPPGADR